MSFELLFFFILIGGWLFGKLFEKIGLPSVLGMTLFGVALTFLASSFFVGDQQAFPDGFWQLVPFIKTFALVIILLRAGLGISLQELKAAGISAVLMSFVPCIVEGLTLMAALMVLFDFSWKVAGLCGFMLAAVSPAVVVPAMLDLKARGLGQRNGVITVVLAGASVDDVFAISLFTVFLGFASGGTNLLALAGIPLSILLGLMSGAVLGLGFAWYFLRFHKSIRASEKTLVIIASAFFLVQLGNSLPIAAFLGLMTLGFVLFAKAPLPANELSVKLEKIWIFAQIGLFVIIGMSIDLSVAIEAGPKALLAIGLGLIARSIGVLLSVWPSKMNWGQKFFCVIAYLPKATVQAALGGVALSYGLPEGKLILAIAVLAIITTAPLGLLGIRLGAPRLLRDKPVLDQLGQ